MAADFLEVHALFAPNLIVGFARIEGVVVGIIANNSMQKAGVLDIDSSDKGARFIRFCNDFNIPVVTLVDVPGFQPGIDQERGGIIRHGAKMLFAYSSTTVPKITIVTRKSYGGAHLAMCSQEMGADFVYAWPTAEIAVMGAEGAVNILYSKEIKEAADPGAAAQGAGGRVPCRIRVAVHGGFARLHHRRDRAVADARYRRAVAAQAARQARTAAAEEARQHPAVSLVAQSDVALERRSAPTIAGEA